MKLIGLLLPLVILTTNGCATYRREAFLKAHSLDQFMADRSQAANVLRHHPALERWLRTEWSRPVGDCRIYWSDEQPTASPLAEHDVAPQYHLIGIRVSKELSPVDQLLALSYETCNAQGRIGFDRVSAQAAAGTITREDFVNEINAREYAAVLRVKKCFLKLLPLSRDEVATTTLYRKFLEVPVEFHEYQDWRIRVDKPNYLRIQELYRRQYDELSGKRSNR